MLFSKQQPQPHSAQSETVQGVRIASPVVVNHRRSLSSVFRTVKTRYSRDRLDKNEMDWQSPARRQVSEVPWLVNQEVPVLISQPRKASPPPCLEMPLDLVGREKSSGPSTFRASLERAVDDINYKYGISSSSESCPSYVIQRGLEQDSQEEKDRPFPAPISFPLSNFRPRYQLPTFTNAPARKAKSSVGEVRNLSSITSAESDPLEEEISEKEDGSCHLPPMLLNEALDSRFDLVELMTTMASQTTSKEADPQRVAAEDGDLSARQSTTFSSPRDSIHNATVEASGKDHAELVSSLSKKSGESATEVTRNTLSTTSSTYESDSLSIAQKTPLPIHQRNRSNSEQATCTTRGSSIKNFDSKSLSSDFGIEVKRVRAKSTSDNAECESVIINSRQPSKTSDELAFADESIPSVSDLVRKFRRMGSPPGELPFTTPTEAYKQYPAIRRISRGKQVERFCNRFTSDSEESSVLSSCARGLVDEELCSGSVSCTAAYEVPQAAEME
ncbi:hypothetical protein E4U42_003512 [Claviceps africana]|uniref:Uncharacterized protein n=1 Tax=Claviceps africana TaxID=83212 RepID=A0A8K0J6Y3_9HYPO|nr:hypothetical protein E4U42_003512 [Claviceps africana]